MPLYLSGILVYRCKFSNPPSKKVFAAAIHSKDGTKLKITNKDQSDAILSRFGGCALYCPNQ